MLTLASPHTLEQEVKKSRFIAHATSVESPEKALAFLESVRHSDANHNCWAYRVEGDRYRFFDDGEPGGTAGRPILAAIEGQGLDNVMVVVVRYFGGIKLGAGGLVRAYGGAAAECLRTARRVEILPGVVLCVHVPFESIGSVYPVLERFGAVKLSETYVEDGVDLQVELEEARRREFEASMRDATRGKAHIEQGQ